MSVFLMQSLKGLLFNPKVFLFYKIFVLHFLQKCKIIPNLVMQTTPVWEQCVTCRGSKLKALNNAELVGEAGTRRQHSVRSHVKPGLWQGTLNTLLVEKYNET